MQTFFPQPLIQIPQFLGHLFPAVKSGAEHTSVQPSKTSVSSVQLFGIRIMARFVQFLKAQLPRYVQLAGIAALYASVPSNALASIVVVWAGSTKSGLSKESHIALSVVL